VIVTVTDRGPAKRLYNKGRRLDLSRAAFQKLSPLSAGLIRVRLYKLPEKTDRIVTYEHREATRMGPRKN